MWSMWSCCRALRAYAVHRDMSEQQLCVCVQQTCAPTALLLMLLAMPTPPNPAVDTLTHSIR
eukprot:m.577379 g.577379  ORF g.577379 m.577379 type:complete len:62 (-) comp22294_c0_seq9:663-848(-)